MIYLGCERRASGARQVAAVEADHERARAVPVGWHRGRRNGLWRRRCGRTGDRGLAISTARKGRDEVRAGAKASDVVNVRRSAGKRPFEKAHPEVWPALKKLVDPVTRGDPESPLR